MAKKKEDYNAKLLIIFSVIYELILYILMPYLEGRLTMTLIFSLTIFLIYFFLFLKKEKRNPLYLIFVVGLIVRTIYIMNTSIFVRQHDVGDINGEGHLGYIYILFNTGHLPTNLHWQFYHPPFWHLIGAIWVWINNLFHLEIYRIIEGLQILTLFFSAFSVIVVDKIIQKVKIKDKYRYLIDLLIAIHPTMIIFSGSINNDCLLLLLEFLVILYLIKLYESISWKNIIILALLTGLSVMTKTNGAVMAVPILYIFINKLINIWKNKKNDLKLYILKIFAFGLISLPIGLWHPIRNIIKFGSTSIPEAGDFLYIGNHSVISRLLIPNFRELMNYANLSSDYSLPIYLIKSSLFGEFSYEKLVIIAKILVILNTILITISLIFMIQYVFQKKKNKYMNILLITWVAFMISMLGFNYLYPFRCTMDFRYIPICLLPGIAIIFYQLEKMENQFIKKSVEVLCYLFAILSIIFMIWAI